MHKKQISPKVLFGVIVAILLLVILLFGSLQSTHSIEIIDVKVKLDTARFGSGVIDEEGTEIFEYPYVLDYTFAIKNTGFSNIGNMYENEYLNVIVIPNEEFNQLLMSIYGQDIFNDESLTWEYEGSGYSSGTLTKHNEVEILNFSIGLGFDQSLYQYEDYPAPTEEELQMILDHAYEVNAFLYIDNSKLGGDMFNSIKEEIGYFDLSEGYDGSLFGTSE